MTLRIQRAAGTKCVVYTLMGRIQADRLADLEALVKSESPESEVTLDLKDVKLVDREAVRFLAKCEEQGTTLRNCAAYIRAWISQERNGTQPQVNVQTSE
jgi:hypothetical protein